MKRQIYWPVFGFMVINPLVAILGTALCLYAGIAAPWIFVFAMVFAIATNMSITAGYHRLFSHRSYDAHPVLEVLYLAIGASAFQGSCLKWSSDHRRHHAEEDTEADPYAIHKGFWHAHIGWLFWKETVDQPIERVADLSKNKRVLFQHRHYLPIAIFMGFVLPMIVGGLVGGSIASAMAGLVIAGSLRIFLTQQSTFFVNSLCHYFGRQTYSQKVSARDSFWVALLTHGEGYHNYHHTFQADYRNGIRWYQWDPTKWMIAALHWMGLARRLRRVAPAEILRARLQIEAARLSSGGFAPERIEQLKHKIIEAQIRWREMKEEYKALRRQAHAVGREKLEALRLEIELAKTEFRYGLKQWRLHLQAVPTYA